MARPSDYRFRLRNNVRPGTVGRMYAHDAVGANSLVESAFKFWGDGGNILVTDQITKQSWRFTPASFDAGARVPE